MGNAAIQGVLNVLAQTAERKEARLKAARVQVQEQGYADNYSSFVEPARLQANEESTSFVQVGAVYTRLRTEYSLLIWEALEHYKVLVHQSMVALDEARMAMEGPPCYERTINVNICLARHGVLLREAHKISLQLESIREMQDSDTSHLPHEHVVEPASDRIQEILRDPNHSSPMHVDEVNSEEETAFTETGNVLYDRWIEGKKLREEYGRLILQSLEALENANRALSEHPSYEKDINLNIALARHKTILLRASDIYQTIQSLDYDGQTSFIQEEDAEILQENAENKIITRAPATRAVQARVLINSLRQQRLQLSKDIADSLSKAREETERPSSFESAVRLNTILTEYRDLVTKSMKITEALRTLESKQSGSSFVQVNPNQKTDLEELHQQHAKLKKESDALFEEAMISMYGPPGCENAIAFNMAMSKHQQLLTQANELQTQMDELHTQIDFNLNALSEQMGLRSGSSFIQIESCHRGVADQVKRGVSNFFNEVKLALARSVSRKQVPKPEELNPEVFSDDDSPHHAEYYQGHQAAVSFLQITKRMKKPMSRSFVEDAYQLFSNMASEMEIALSRDPPKKIAPPLQDIDEILKIYHPLAYSPIDRKATSFLQVKPAVPMLDTSKIKPEEMKPKIKLSPRQLDPVGEPKAWYETWFDAVFCEVQLALTKCGTKDEIIGPEPPSLEEIRMTDLDSILRSPEGSPVKFQEFKPYTPRSPRSPRAPDNTPRVLSVAPTPETTPRSPKKDSSFAESASNIKQQTGQAINELSMCAHQKSLSRTNSRSEKPKPVEVRKTGVSFLQVQNCNDVRCNSVEKLEQLKLFQVDDDTLALATDQTSAKEHYGNVVKNQLTMALRQLDSIQKSTSFVQVDEDFELLTSEFVKQKDEDEPLVRSSYRETSTGMPVFTTQTEQFGRAPPQKLATKLDEGASPKKQSSFLQNSNSAWVSDQERMIKESMSGLLRHAGNGRIILDWEQVKGAVYLAHLYIQSIIFD